MTVYIKWLGLIAGCMAMLACMSMEPMPLNKEKLKQELHPDDKVEVYRKSGERTMFTIRNVDDQGIHGHGIDVPFREIKTVTREETSWWRTSLVVLGGVAAVALAASGVKGGKGGIGGGSSTGGGGGGW